jgi:hypothetical protein
VTPEKLTPEQLAAIRERHGATTPGEWTFECGSICDWGDSTFTMEWIDNRKASADQRDADGTFMAAAHQDIPALLAHVAALEAEVDMLRRYGPPPYRVAIHFGGDDDASCLMATCQPVEDALSRAQEELVRVEGTEARVLIWNATGGSMEVKADA